MANCYRFNHNISPKFSYLIKKWFTHSINPLIFTERYHKESNISHLSTHCWFWSQKFSQLFSKSLLFCIDRLLNKRSVHSATRKCKSYLNDQNQKKYSKGRRLCVLNFVWRTNLYQNVTYLRCRPNLVNRDDTCRDFHEKMNPWSCD